MPFLKVNTRSLLWFQGFKKQLPPINYITLHYLYFIMMCLLASIVFWLLGGARGKERFGYTDCLFLVVSAMTEAGLNTVNLSEMNTAQQTILFVLIIIGSSIFVSIATVWSRKFVIEARFKYLLKLRSSGGRRRSRNHSGLNVRLPADDFNGEKAQLEMRKIAKEHGDMSEFESRHSEPRDPISGRGVGEGDGDGEIAVIEQDRVPHLRYAHTATSPGVSGRGRVLSFAGVGAHPMSTSFHKTEGGEGSYLRGRERGRGDEKEIEELGGAEYPNYLTRHTTGRNSQFFNLTREEREHLGGVEYRAIKLLGYVVPAYFLIWQIIGCTGLAAYFAHNKAMLTEANGINPWWLGYFNGVSAFNNSGMSLLDANMIPFQTAVYPLMQMGIMILAGNTAYPIFLRFILWTMLKTISSLCPSEDQYAEFKATLRFILKYPRRVYTHLFPAPATRWLLFVVLCLNGIDWVAFELLNLHNPSVTNLPPGFRVLDGLFQALAVRSGGFYVFAITDLRIGLQVLYVIMMYISVYPVVITMRHSNVYEERSLGIYADDPQIINPEFDPENRNGGASREKKKHPIASKFRSRFHAATNLNRGSTGTQFIRQQISGQLTHDLWLLILAIFIISCIEGTNFETDPVGFSVFNIAFEVVSGYGCVGISTGTPMAAYSFAGTWHTGSKLVLVGVMLRGRHRGLPVALDRAVELPVGSLHGGVAEEEDWGVRRTFSRGGGGAAIF